MAVEPGDKSYKCTLDSAGKKKAREELNEIESDRARAVQTFRSWVLEQRAWLKSPTDFAFLLRFLRVRKYSQVGARQTLENYITIKTQVPQWFQDLDAADETLQALYRTGFIYGSTKLDKNGRRFVIRRPGLLDSKTVKKYGVDNIMRAAILVWYWCAHDENSQVNGTAVLFDLTELSLYFCTHVWNVENLRRKLKFYEFSLPMRLKQVHLFNAPPVFDALYQMAKPFLKDKTINRIHTYGKNLSEAYDYIDKADLPDEYLPDDYTGPSRGPVKDVIEEMIADMLKPEFRNYMKEISSSKYTVDLSKKPKTDTPIASYRKLDVS